MKQILLLFLSVITLFAYVDSDMDGVEDAADHCPNTPITELVDASGCTIKSLKSKHQFDIIVGAGYSELDYTTNEKTDTMTASLQVDYYYKNFSLLFSTSTFRSQSDTYSNSGMNDSTLAGYYRFVLADDLSVRAGAGVILPTYDSSLDNEAADFLGSLSLSYRLNKASFFTGYTYTIINDDDVGTITYRNTNAFSGGAGYYLTPKLYSSLSYYQSDSIYRSVESIKKVSLYSFYSFDANWFATANYSMGLSDSASDNSVSLRLGCYF